MIAHNVQWGIYMYMVLFRCHAALLPAKKLTLSRRGTELVFYWITNPRFGYVSILIAT